eukprot:g25594.t1
MDFGRRCRPEEGPGPGSGERPEEGPGPGRVERPEEGAGPGRVERPEEGAGPGSGERPLVSERDRLCRNLFICSFGCGATFSKNWRLLAHLCRHTGE